LDASSSFPSSLRKRRDKKAVPSRYSSGIGERGVGEIVFLQKGKRGFRCMKIEGGVSFIKGKDKRGFLLPAGSNEVGSGGEGFSCIPGKGEKRICRTLLRWSDKLKERRERKGGWRSRGGKRRRFLEAAQRKRGNSSREGGGQHDLAQRSPSEKGEEKRADIVWRKKKKMVEQVARRRRRGKKAHVF